MVEKPDKKKAKGYEKEKRALLDKYGLLERPSLEFPMYREYPDDLKLALIVVQKHRPQFATALSLKEKEENKDEHQNPDGDGTKK